MRIIISILIAILSTLTAGAQEATVKRVEALPFEVIPTPDRRVDLNGNVCALVHVEVLADDVTFEGNVIGTVSRKGGEYLVYLSPGTKFLRIKSNTFLPVKINFADYDIDGLQPGCVYAITLSLPAMAGQQTPPSATAGMNYLLLSVSPPTATVTVDGKPREVRAGTAKMLLSHGTHTYRVEAPGYLPDEGSVTIGKERVERSVTLRSTKGTLEVSATTPGTEIYINGERVGTSSWLGQLLPDTYSVEGRLPGHRPFEQLVTVKTGDSQAITIGALIPITGSLNIDYEPAGAAITIDGTNRGTSPAIIDNLVIGQHTVVISAPGYDSATLSATVTEGTLSSLSGALTASQDVNYEEFEDRKTGKYGYKDGTGKIVIPAKFDFAGSFTEGLANVEINSKYGFIDKSGQLVIPAKFDDAIPFSEGLALVRINGKYGFIDKSGQLVIPAKFDDAWSFWMGKAKVRLNGREFYIDHQGNEVR